MFSGAPSPVAEAPAVRSDSELCHTFVASWCRTNLLPCALTDTTRRPDDNAHLRNPSTESGLRDDTYALATPFGRLPGTPGHDAARAFLENRFAELGLAGYPGLDAYRHQYRSRNGLTMTNLAGIVPGTNPGAAPVLIGAHYDSVIEAPCADDNAAGVAVLLQTAARLAATPLERDVVVVAFDAEEPPYFISPDMGSSRFVDEVVAGPVHLAIILDLIGHQIRIPGLSVDPDLMFVVGAESHPSLPGLLDGLSLPVAAAPQSAVGDFSDYAAFREAGAPYLFFSCGEWEHYHRPTDHPDLMDYPKMARLVDDLERVMRRSDAVRTGYHATVDATEFEADTLERALGTEMLAQAAAMLGRSGYRTADDLRAIIGGLRGRLS